VDDTASRWQPESDEEYEAARTELKRRFAIWATRGDDVFNPDAPEGLLHYKWGYVDGHLTLNRPGFVGGCVSRTLEVR